MTKIWFGIMDNGKMTKIKNGKQLHRAYEYLDGMKKIVVDMKKEPINPKRLKMWLEPYQHEIRKVAAEIREFLKAELRGG